MMDEITVDNNTIALPFDVVVVSDINTSSKLLDTSMFTLHKPVSIKIKVKNKEEMAQDLGISKNVPKKLRLVSSDQTIISFKLLMEKENEQRTLKKPHYKFFKLFKTSACFNNQNDNDDDVYPYVPSSSNETHRAKSMPYVKGLHDDKILEEQFALRKDLSPTISSNIITLRTPTFLGKCKPGGCLDPPFGEDKYIYKPKRDMLASQKNIEDQASNEKYNMDIEYLAKDKNRLDTSSQDSPSKLPVEKTFDNSLITYPPALSSSKVRVQEVLLNKKSKLRTSTERKGRMSIINEFSDTYFILPKRQNSNNKEKISGEISQNLNVRSYDAKSNRGTYSLSSQKESSPLSSNINQDSGLKILDSLTVTRCQNETQNLKCSSIPNISVAELKVTDNILENKLTSFEGSNNLNPETQIDIDTFEINIKRSSTSIMNLTDKASQVITFESNSSTEVLSKSRLMQNGSVNNHSPVQNTLKNQSLDKEITYIKKELEQNSSLQNVYSTEIITKKMTIETNDIFVKQDTDSVRDKNNDRGLTTLIQHSQSDQKIISMCNDNAPGDLIGLKSNQTEWNSYAADTKSGLNITQDYINSKIKSHLSSSTFQVHDKTNNEQDKKNYENNLATSQVVTSSLNIPSLELPKIRPVMQTQEKNTIIDDSSCHVNNNISTSRQKIQENNRSILQTRQKETIGNNSNSYHNKTIRTTAEIVKLSSSLTLLEKSLETQEKYAVSNDFVSDEKRNELDTSPILKLRSSPLALSEKISATLQIEDNDIIIDHSDSDQNRNIATSSPKYSLYPMPSQTLPKKNRLILQTREKETSEYNVSSYLNKTIVTPSEMVKLSSSLALPEKTSSTLDTQEQYAVFNGSESEEKRNELFTSPILNLGSSPLALSHKVSTILQIQEKDTIRDDSDSYENENILHSGHIITPKSSLNLMSSVALVEKNRSVLLTKKNETVENSTGAYENKTILSTSEIVRLSSSLESPVTNSSLKIQEQYIENNDPVSDTNRNEINPRQISQSTSSLSLTTPLILPEIASSILQTQNEETVKSDSVKYKNKIILTTSQTVKRISSLNLPSQVTGSILQIQENDARDKYSIDNQNKISLSTGQILKLPSISSVTDDLKAYNSDGVIKGLVSNAPVEIQSLTDIDGSHGISTKDIIKREESVNEDTLNIRTELQINSGKVTPTLSDNKLARDFAVSLNKNKSVITSKHYQNYQRPSIESIMINDDKVNVPPEEVESLLRHKKSSIEINLGFYTYVNDNNETVIKTFDTSEQTKKYAQAKKTIIKSIIRKNDSLIRIPVNSEIDLTMEIKTTEKGYHNINVYKKESKDTYKPLKKDLVLQETLNSVYENLVPVENIIRNLKQEADFLTQQQVMLREILNTIKTTSVKYINAHQMCTCKKKSP